MAANQVGYGWSLFHLRSAFLLSEVSVSLFLICGQPFFHLRSVSVYFSSVVSLLFLLRSVSVYFSSVVSLLFLLRSVSVYFSSVVSLLFLLRSVSVYFSSVWSVFVSSVVCLYLVCDWSLCTHFLLHDSCITELFYNNLSVEFFDKINVLTTLKAVADNKSSSIFDRVDNIVGKGDILILPFFCKASPGFTCLQYKSF